MIPVRPVCVIALAFVAGCHEDIADLDTVFYAGGPRPVHCAVDIDTRANAALSSIDGALDRARDRDEVVEIYAHKPSETVPVATIEHLLAGAQARGLPFVTYGDFARGGVSGPGLALSFDDSAVELWTAIRPLFQQYGARVTFFVSRYDVMSDDEHAGLHDLARDGHEIQAHTINHLHAPDYVERYGLDQYLRDEALPSIDLLRADGFEVSAFAYPFGVRTDETDRALLQVVPVLRSVAYTWEPIDDPCPL